MTEQERLKTQGEIGDEAGAIQWVLTGWIPRSHITLLVGQPGVGKSMVAQWLAECVFGTRAFPDGSRTQEANSGQRRKTLVIDTEGCRAVYGIRCNEMSLTRDAIIFPPESYCFHIASGQTQHIIDSCLQAESHISLIVLDSLRGAHSGNENESENATAIMKTLMEIARKHNVGLLGIHHLRKGNPLIPLQTIELDNVRGSSAYTQFARSVIALSKNHHDQDILRLAQIKNNFCELQPAIGLRITEAGIEVCDLPGEPSRTLQTDKAQDFLRSRLKDGPVPAGQLEKEAKERKISRATLYRAAEGFIERTPEGWRLPGK